MYNQVIQNIVDYIDLNVQNDITVDSCADISGYSKYHLHRIFSYYTGFNIMAYIRKRKLMYAMKDISDGKRVLDVALDYGYNSERTFRRAFINEFGLTPGACRNRNYLITSPIRMDDLNTLGGKRMETYLSEVFFETLEDMHVASATIFSNNPEDEVIEKVNRWMHRQGYTESRGFGFDVPISKDMDEGMRGYEYWRVLPDKVTCSDELVCKFIEGTEYAVIRITDPFDNPFERIPKAWGRMLEWIKEKAYDKIAFSGNRYCFEEVKELDGKTYMDIYVAVK